MLSVNTLTGFGLVLFRASLCCWKTVSASQVSKLQIPAADSEHDKDASEGLGGA